MPGRAGTIYDLVEAWIETRRDLAPDTIRHDRWAAMLLADTYDDLPRQVPGLVEFMHGQGRYLGGRSQQTVWDRLRLLYDWARDQGKAVPRLPYVGFGRRRRGERRGRKANTAAT